MKRFFVVFTFCSVTFFAVSLQNVYAEGYGMAGCGLGGLILGDKPGKGPQLGAMLLNTIGVQTLALTSGTSACSDGKAATGIIRAQVEQKVYVESNLELLKSDLAKGEGETLMNLAFLMGCQQQDYSLFSTVAQKNYGMIFADGSQASFVHYNIKQLVRGNSVLANSCSLVSK